MAEIIDTKPKGFSISLPVKDAKSKTGTTTKSFVIKAPTIAFSRKYFEMVRLTSDSADTTDIRSREAQVKMAMNGASPEVINECKKELTVLESLYAERDKNYLDGRTKICHSLLVTEVKYEEIDWDNCDLQEVNTAINFFRRSTGTDKLAPTI
jgi:hypothetical protein